MPDFRNMTIVEMGNHLSALRDSLPSRPDEVLINNMSEMLIAFCKNTQ